MVVMNFHVVSTMVNHCADNGRSNECCKRTNLARFLCKGLMGLITAGHDLVMGSGALV